MEKRNKNNIKSYKKVLENENKIIEIRIGYLTKLLWWLKDSLPCSKRYREKAFENEKNFALFKDEERNEIVLTVWSNKSKSIRLTENTARLLIEMINNHIHGLHNM